MNRDGHLQSLWQPGISNYEPINSWEKDKLYDVLIVGAGITGLTTALLLQEAGKKCIIAEAHNVGFGTSGGTTAHLNTMLDSSYDQIIKNFGAEAAKLVGKGCEEAIRIVKSLSIRYHIDADFEWKDGYLFAQDEKEEKELDEIFDGTQASGIKVEWAPDIPVPLPFTKVARFPEQAQIHATKYMNGLAKAFESNGGVILQNCIVEKADHADEHFAVDTSLGTIKAARVVYATHIPPGVNILHFRCAPYRSYAAAFTLNNDAYPPDLAYDLKDPYHYFRTHVVDGQKYVIGGGFDHKTGHEKNTEHVFTELEAYLRQHFDVAAIAFKWSAQYYNSADGLPYIGLLPGHDKTYCATGFSGNGMILGSLSGRILSDIILEQETPYKELFNPSRIKPVAGFLEFVKENADVVSQFIGQRFAYEKVSSLAELAPGEGKLADWEGKKVALYKDEKGKVFAVDPVCPHAKCVVGWNSAEQSWDCPCHGARYAPNGSLLTGPARRGLTPLLWEDFEGD